MNGVLNLSVLDGWWCEGYDGANGWAIEPLEDGDEAAQDVHDAAELYRLLEDESRLYRLCMGKKANGEIYLAFDGEQITMDMLADKVNEKRLELNKIDEPYLTALFLVDRKVPMEKVHKS